MRSDTLLDVDGIVLVRLLVRPESFTMGTLAQALQSLLWLCDKATARKVADASIARLKKAAHIWPDTKFILTDEGKRAALERLGLSSLPRRQRTDWRWAKKLLLVQRFRFTAGAAGDAGKSAHLAAWIIALKEKLPLGAPPTPAAVLQALAWRALGLPDNGPLRGNTAVGALLGLSTPAIDEPAATPPTQQQAPQALPMVEPTPRGPAAAELPMFARTVNQLALSAKTGTWIGNKVYVAQLWRDFMPEHGAPKPSLDAFKQRLVAAARAGHILLSRADLVGAYPPEALQESQIEAGGEVYHFVETQHLR